MPRRLAPLFPYLLLTPGLLLCSAPTLAQDQGQDWNNLNILRDKIGDKTYKQPQQAVNALRGFVRNDALHPMVAAEVYNQIARINVEGLQQPETAVQIGDCT